MQIQRPTDRLKGPENWGKGPNVGWLPQTFVGPLPR